MGKRAFGRSTNSFRGNKKRKPKTFNEKVKAVFDKQVEVKKVTKLTGSPNNLENPINVSYTGVNLVQVTPGTSQGPAINVGPDSDERIGNEIEVKKCVFKLAIYPAIYSIDSNSVPMPQNIMLYVWSMKASEGAFYSNAQTILTTTFLDNNSAAIGFTGVMKDFMREVNTQSVTLYKKKLYKMGASGYINNSGAQDEAYNYTNNDYKLSIMDQLDLTSYLPKKITFDGTSADATSRKVFVTLIPVDADGSIPADGIDSIPATWDHSTILHYTDA
jgi:hypothetical protein